MRIDIFANDQQILVELGERIRHARIKTDLTQNALAEDCGVAKSTIERAEKGESIQLLILIKILRSLNLINRLESILPDTQATPLESLQHQKAQKRVRTKTSDKQNTFKWGDEK